jgi:hypothetical protein
MPSDSFLSANHIVSDKLKKDGAICTTPKCGLGGRVAPEVVVFGQACRHTAEARVL